MEMSGWWSSLLESWPYSKRALFMVGTFVLHAGTSCVFNLCFYVIYKWKLFAKYKIRPEPDAPLSDKTAWRNVHPPRALVLKALKQTVLSQTTGQWLSLYLAWSGLGLASQPTVPSAVTTVVHIIIMLILNDFGFYWGHRALHAPALYRFHKQHHAFTASIGLAAEYAHPVENVLTNALPTFLAVRAVRPHITTFWLFLFLRIWETTESHSGYAFPWSVWSFFSWQGGARQHDFHHSHNIGNFGGLFSCFWDRVCGTDKAYRAHLAKQAR